jgi:hypothetical protein
MVAVRLQTAEPIEFLSGKNDRSHSCEISQSNKKYFHNNHVGDSSKYTDNKRTDLNQGQVVDDS